MALKALGKKGKKALIQQKADEEAKEKETRERAK